MLCTAHRRPSQWFWGRTRDAGPARASKEYVFAFLSACVCAKVRRSRAGLTGVPLRVWPVAEFCHLNLKTCVHTVLKRTCLQ